MPDFILTVGATRCAHDAAVHPPAGPVRVRIDGSVVLSTTAAVEGCGKGPGMKTSVPSKPVGATGAPAVVAVSATCGEVRWAHPANRVKIGGHPVLLAHSTGVCPPSDTPVKVGSMQTRVKAT